MKNKAKFLLQNLIYIFLVVICNYANANQYVGFNLCKDTEKQVEAVIQSSGGDAANYPIATGKYEIETAFYDEKLLSISIKSPENLSYFLNEKYGKPKQTRSKDYSGMESVLDEYFDKKNSNVKIENLWGTYRGIKASVHLVYTCKSLSQKKLRDEKRVEAEEIKAKNTGKQL